MKTLSAQTTALLTAVPLIIAVPAPASSLSHPRPAPQTTGTESRVPVERPWHTAIRLREALAATDSPEPAAILELARAEAGWRNWTQVSELLADAEWLDEVNAGEGWLLLGLAAEAEEDWAAAEQALGAWLAGGSRDEEAVLRLVRIRARLNRSEDALGTLDAITTGRTDFFDSRMRLEVAEILAPLGDTAGVRLASGGITDDEIRERTWLLRSDAYLTVADSTAAETFLDRTVASISDDGRRARGWARLGELRQARGDREGALAAFRAVLDAVDRGSAATLAATAVAESGTASTDDLPALGRVLQRGGETGLALGVYDRYVEEASTSPPLTLRLARARLMAGAGRLSEARDEFSSLAGSEDPEVGAPALDNLVRVQRRLGAGGAAETAQEQLVERFPGSRQAVDFIFFRADADHDTGRLSQAMEGYGQTASMAPTMDRAGLARMRLGQLHIGAGDHQHAAAVFENYLADFPEGRRWQEAAYWAAWARLRLGDQERTAAHVALVTRGDPLSYYAFLGAELLGQDHEPELDPDPPFDESGVFWMYEPLREAGLLKRAGMKSAAAEAAARLVERAEGSPGALLRLAEGLIAERMHIEGIRVAGRAQSAGYPRSPRLVRAAYPLPYRDVIFDEAAKREVDPFLMAALMRQESAFDAEIVSSAGAVGLMQVMPATGRELARREGPRPFSAASLRVADVNLHLGSRYLAQMLARYDGQLPLVLSAYNAGPSRANRWRRLPEASDLQRFTERIPFFETRNYVKNVERNLRVYRWLYGDDS
ncbi:MAG: lytic transglycosylase domain-containing protein [Gammaproteobacteria bacterium]|nr:lytic transglycosylase domain-containing protein [Gammaproteobacteria bacterium]